MQEFGQNDDLIYLVEGETLTVMWLKEILEEHAFTVQTIPGIDALNRAIGRVLPHAVVVDLASPGQEQDMRSVLQGLRFLRQMYPGLCLVALATGVDGPTSYALSECKAGVIYKPFRSDQLLGSLHQCGIRLPASRARAH